MRNWTNKEIKYLKENYQKSPGKEIALYLGKTLASVRCVALKLGVKKRDHKYQVNSNFFDNWSYDMAYILGLLITDGCMEREKTGHNKISLAFHWNDRDHFKKVLEVMDSRHKIYKHKTKQLGCFKIGDVKLCTRLKELGITERKSLNVCVADFLDEFIPSFLLGVMDGDGSVSEDRGSIRFYTASPFFRDQVIYFLANKLNLNIGFNIKKSKDDNRHDLYCIGIYTKDEIKKLAYLMYENTTIYLERKYKRLVNLGLV